MRSRFGYQCIVCLLVLIGQVPARGHDHGESPAKLDAAEQHAPSVLPDRVVLTWSGDPAHSQDVSWRTSSEVTHSVVEFAAATEGPYFTENAVRLHATTNPFESDLGTYHLHTAKMAALAPETKYAYRVGDGVNWSEWFHFTTAADQPKPFTFIYFGDAQNDIRSLWSRIIREAYSDAPKASFMLHAGDLVNVAQRDAEWGEWFGGGAWLNAMMPSIATPGNHEYHRVTGEDGERQRRVLSKHWQPTFSFPMNGPDGLKESVYWMDYQGTRFISLNSNEQQAIQAEWLDQVLASNPNRWTIVTFHHPMYSSARGRDNVGLRHIWKPILDKYKVDLVLQGHDHSYARTGLELPEDAENLDVGVNVKSGSTVYVVSVSGPKQYDVGDRFFFQRKASGAQLYQIINVDHDRIRYEARVANGQLYDAFELRKDSDSAVELVNLRPATPEVRKPLEVRITQPEVASAADAGQAAEAAFAARRLQPDAIMSLRDKDKDGKLSGDEIPQLMRDRLPQFDTDKDGHVSADELKQAIGRLRERAAAK